MIPLKVVLPDASGKVIYVFYDLRQRKIRITLTNPHCTYLISSAFSTSVRSAKMRKTVESAYDAVRGSTRSGMIWEETC